MKLNKSIKILLCISFSHLVHAEQENGNDQVYYFVQESELVVIDKVDPRQVRIPNIHAIKAVDIVLVHPGLKLDEDQDGKKKGSDVDKGAEALKISPKEVSKYILKAKKLFNKGDVVGAWDVVDRLEEVAPNNYRIKTMKGSLFYRAGEYEKAIMYWKESLKLNRNQAEVRAMIRKAERESKR
jgi:tetratricopeptide (TPR) repeat protein